MVISDTVRLFESPFDKMRLTVGFSVESPDARMNSGLDIGVKLVEWDNPVGVRLEGFRNGERLFNLPASVLASDVTIQGVCSTWTLKQ